MSDDAATKLAKQSDKLNKLYMTALKSVVRERKESGYGHGRIGELAKPIYKAKAAFRASLKTPGKKLYIKTALGQTKSP